MERVRGIWDRIPLFWRFQLAGWLAFTIFSFPSKWVMLETIPASVLVSLYRDGLGFLITIGMREIYRRSYHDKMTKVGLGVMVAGVSLASGLVLTLFSLGFHEFLDFDAEKTFTPPIIFGIFYFRTGLCLGWSLLYFGIKLMRESMDRDLRIARAQATSERAELQMLRAQMNPHFLFNALTMIQAGIARREPHLDEVVQSMAEYLRYSLENRHNDRVPLGNEFDAIKGFLIVEKARFREELEFECHIDESVRDTLAPGVIMQPLVENALKYGRKTSSTPLRIQLRVRLSNEHTIRIEVANTGQWLKDEKLNQVSGVGLENLEKRLKLLYPGTYGLRHLEENGWVTVQIDIPATP